MPINVEQFCQDIIDASITVFVENCGELDPTGSGVLVQYENISYMISVAHVFDMKDKQYKIENDPDEEGIPQDDMENVYVSVEGNNKDNCRAFNLSEMPHCILSVTYDPSTKEHCRFNEEDEFVVKRLTKEDEEFFRLLGKRFFSISEIEFDKTLCDCKIILSGYPAFAQHKNLENKWDMNCKLLECKYDKLKNGHEIHTEFSNHDVYDFFNRTTIKFIGANGIQGMSGGGIWLVNDKSLKLIGLITAQKDNGGVLGCSINRFVDVMQSLSHS